MIEALTGIRRSPTQVRLFLKHLGLRCLKVGLLPAKGDPQEQEAYQKKVRAPLSRSTRGEACGLFCGCGAFCLRRVSQLPLVFRPVLDQGAPWAAALQCLGRAQCGHPRRDHRHHADLSIRNLINRHISQLTLLQIGTEVIAMSGYQYTALYPQIHPRHG